MERKSIEQFFLNTLLKISIGGVGLILVADVALNPTDITSIVLDCLIIAAATIAYFIRNTYSNVSVITLTSIVLLAIAYQCIILPISTTNSLSVILLVGFIHAVMLTGRRLMIMQGIAVSVVVGIFVFQFFSAEMMYAQHRNELATIIITYCIIFLILTYATTILKASYDRINGTLREFNMEISQKANEIETQNEELMQMQDNLHSLNTELEKLVYERTSKIQVQNEILLKYSYANAHHLRGPVARLLGLANVYRTNSSLTPDFIIERMVDQATEIDNVVKQINIDLEAGRVSGVVEHPGIS